MNALFLKCIMLASGQIEIATTPIDEYAMATIIKDHQGAHFEATVIEGKMNSILVGFPKYNVETMSYSIKDYELKSLSAKLSYKNEFATMDCEIAEY